MDMSAINDVGAILFCNGAHSLGLNDFRVKVEHEGEMLLWL